MESGALSADGFADFADDVVLFCHITSRVEGDPHPDLLQEKGGRGFPTLVFMDHEGEVLHKQGGRTVEAFQDSLAALKTLEEYAGKDDPTANTKTFIARLKLGKLGFEEAKEKLAKLPDLTPAQKKTVDNQMIMLEVQSVREKHGRDAAAAGEHFAKMAKEGRIPKGFDAVYFWQPVMQWAEKQKDAELYEKAMNGAMEALDHNERYQRYYDQWKKTLEDLK